MAKLYFYYGAMNCGKTTSLLQMAHNYEEHNKKVILIKSIVDTKGEDYLVTRIGLERKVDILLKEKESVIEKLKGNLNGISCIFVDEAQFFNHNQITEFWKISKIYDIPVMCYGLRNDFKTNGFPGSMRLMALADEIKELMTICRCGKPAKFNARKVNGEFVSEGEQVAIDNTNNVTYEPLCDICYLEVVLKEKKVKKLSN